MSALSAKNPVAPSRLPAPAAARPMGRAADRVKDCAANVLMLRKIAGWFASRPRRGATIAERLGFDRTARLLIINADDFGLCHEQNLATIEGLRRGAWSSASVMVPCPGFGEACEYVRREPDADIGIHLTLTSEWDRNRWRPILDADKVRSLVDADGCFWRSRTEVFSLARPDEVEGELRAQIESALAAGIDVTHLDSHMFILNTHRRDLQQIYLRLARDYSLPLRAAWRTIMHWYGFGAVPAQAEQLGILCPDNFAVMSRVRPSRMPVFWTALLRTLPPGLTEICCHPAYAQGGLAGFADDAAHREAEFRFFTSERARRIIKSRGIRLVGYRLLRDAMRCAAGNRRARSVPN